MTWVRLVWSYYDNTFVNTRTSSTERTIGSANCSTHCQPTACWETLRRTPNCSRDDNRTVSHDGQKIQYIIGVQFCIIHNKHLCIMHTILVSLINDFCPNQSLYLNNTMLGAWLSCFFCWKVHQSSSGRIILQKVDICQFLYECRLIRPHSSQHWPFTQQYQEDKRYDTYRRTR